MSLKDIGEKANQVENEVGLTIDDVLNKLTQEVGELNDAIQKYRGRYCKERSEETYSIEGELGDVMMNLTSLASRLGIDPDNLPKYAQNTLEKFHDRKSLYMKNLNQASYQI